MLLPSLVLLGASALLVALYPTYKLFEIDLSGPLTYAE